MAGVLTTLTVGIFAVFFQLYLNRVSTLVSIFHIEFGKEKVDEKHMSFFAKKLSGFPLFLAKVLFKAVLCRLGEHCWKTYFEDFSKEHSLVRSSRKSLKKKGL